MYCVFMHRSAPSTLIDEKHAGRTPESPPSRLIKVNCQLRADLKRRLDIYAAERGLKLQDVFDMALEAYLLQSAQ